MLSTGQIENKSERQLEAVNKVYNITSFPNHQGLYFEHHGPVKVTRLSWDLVAYIDLATPTSRFSLIKSRYADTVEICKQVTERFLELSPTCDQFVQTFARATLPYMYEIEANHRNMMVSIGYNSSEGGRTRRGLGSKIQRMTNFLYGIYSKIDTEFIFDKILALSESKIKDLNLIPERTRIVQAETENQMKQLSKHQQKLEENCQFLQEQAKQIIQKLNKVEFRSRLLEQSFLFEVILNQYAYETQNLMSIVNSALDGKIHTSVFTSSKLLTEFREIKMNLPVGTSLPLVVNTESLTELIRISEIAIFHRDDHLVFAIGIPLISNEGYTMYRPVSLPIPYDKNTVILIDPEVDYLALSNNNEHFFCIRIKSMGTMY